jgi:RNA polymerase sigma factor (sigma-70 family)
MTQEDEFRLVKIAQQDFGGVNGRRAMQLLLRRHKGFLQRIVMRYANNRYLEVDVRAHALIGFTEGVRRFNAAEGVKLLSFVVWWVRREIQAGLYDLSLISVPQHEIINMQMAGRVGELVDLRNWGLRYIYLDKYADFIPLEVHEGENGYAERLDLLVKGAMKLTARDLAVIRGERLGLGLRTIGRHLGISQERVRQVLNKRIYPKLRRAAVMYGI